MGGRREVSIIFYRPVTRSDLKRERSFFRGSVSSFLQLVVACLARGLCAEGYTDFAGVRVQIPANLNLFRLFANARVSLFRCDDLLYYHVLLCSSWNRYRFFTFLPSRP